ncbi:SHOCT domain-containing protein [Sulfuricurvum sp.]|uniref:SHOCT domain-containing protein n=1 Tax=Sulfuricurvum sp. TaxID=2025608 RepID=UPI003BB1701C
MTEFGMHGWGFGMGIGWLIPLLFMVIVVYYIKENQKEGDSARDILDKRYAKGEIDEKEYKTKKADLEQ